jgi:hypothetical protein
MRVTLHEIQEEVQAGRTVITTVKPVLVKIEARAHPQGIACHLRILSEQRSTALISEQVFPNLRALCAALSINEQESRWQASPQEQEPNGHIPFLFF